jgi:hypothetical protein
MLEVVVLIWEEVLKGRQVGINTPYVAYGGHSEDSGLKKAQVDEIVRVCGSTHIPKVQQLMKVFFNSKDLLLLDVTPLSFGHRDRRRRHEEAHRPQHPDPHLEVADLLHLPGKSARRVHPDLRGCAADV